MLKIYSANQKADLLINKIKQRIYECEERLLSISFQFREEILRHSNNFGNICLILGPQSSGKTHLKDFFLEVSPGSKSLNRKKLFYDILKPSIDMTFFADALSDVSSILNSAISSRDFYNMPIGSFDLPFDKEYLKKLQLDFKKIIDSSQYYMVVNSLIFNTYYDSMKTHLLSGQNVFLDDSFLISEEVFYQFKLCCGEYPYIYRALLFADFETTLQNCIIRNSKFTAKLAKSASNKSIAKLVEELECASGGSSLSYRLPKSIITGHKSSYCFKDSATEKDTILAIYSKEDMRSILSRIAKEQLKVLGLLYYRDGRIAEGDLDLDVSDELSYFFKEGKSKVYCVCIEVMDTILNAKTISTLDKDELVSYLLSKLPWLKISVGAYDDFNKKQPENSFEQTESYIEPISFNIKRDLFVEISKKSSLAIIQDTEIFHYLKDFSSVIVDNLLAGKVIHFPFFRYENKLVQFVAEFDGIKTIYLTYYNPKQSLLEYDGKALSILPHLGLNIKERDLSCKIFDLSRGGESFALITSDILDTIFSECNFRLEWSICSEYYWKNLFEDVMHTLADNDYEYQTQALYYEHYDYQS